MDNSMTESSPVMPSFYQHSSFQETTSKQTMPFTSTTSPFSSSPIPPSPLTSSPSPSPDCHNSFYSSNCTISPLTSLLYPFSSPPRFFHRLLVPLLSALYISMGAPPVGICFVSATTSSGAVEQASIYGHYDSEEAAYDKLMKGGGTVDQHDLQLAIGRSWWKLSQALILRSHKEDRDFSTFVRSAVADIRHNTDELIRLLNKKHAEIAVMSPAFQWAQSPEQIFLNIKFAYRWSSPGALSVENEKIETKACCFYFSGVGTHSHVKKEYRLELDLFDDLDATETKWSFASVGKVFVTLQKKTSGVWKQLTRSPAKFPNMAVWWDMKEKFYDTNKEFLSEAKNNTAADDSALDAGKEKQPVDENDNEKKSGGEAEADEGESEEEEETPSTRKKNDTKTPTTNTTTETTSGKESVAASKAKEEL
eukprot:GHVS01026246.1.p1 GENE.GHVS01026246.1~~GHVS01026246.1.p1  ORF type:complete len:422 (+),score=118.52 GHVS01026246.1:70-1335(+)